MKRLDPKAVWLFFLANIVRWFIFAVVAVIAIFVKLLGDDGLMGPSQMNTLFKWILLVIPAVLVVDFIAAKLTHYYYRYELTEMGFRKESGIIWKRYVTIPYDRIQNVDIYRGILARILGLSDLHIQTAGSSAVAYGNAYGGMASSEGRLPGLDKNVAEQLRDELIARTRRPQNQGL